MNYLAHAREVLDHPWTLAGTALPDWLSACDRSARLRPWNVPTVPEGCAAPQEGLILGLRRHFEDDAWFHTTPAFSEVRAEITGHIRGLDDGRMLRGSFFAHLLLEILLDATLVEETPSMAEDYYAALEAVDPEIVAHFADSWCGRPVEGLADLIERFRRARVFDAFSDDVAVVRRLEAVGMRVGLPPLPGGLAEVAAATRPLLRARAADLLTPPDA